ncbi:MAG: ribonuclease III [Thermodesulfobacteriota bacterium]|nr:ribonuclease III [Thermodesulfobacteriota bacterium]
MGYDILLETLQQRLGYQFNSIELLRCAFIHRSFANEQLRDPAACNERQEFLGDAVLDLVMADVLYHKYPELPEGELSRIRAELVSAPALAGVARQLCIGDCLQLGRGEYRSGGQDKDNLLADALEAVFGAIFLDGGWSAVHGVLAGLFGDGVQHVVGRKSQDYKTRFQEFAQARYGQAPVYELVATEGPDHQREYTVAVSCDGQSIGQGQGRSKKAAQQQAACIALNILEADDCSSIG